MAKASGPVRITKPLLDVLEALIQADKQGYALHGWAIIKATGRTGPTIYGVLDRLEDAGWLEGQWEERNPDPRKPPRRFYTLTGIGAPAARALLAKRRPEALNPRLVTDYSIRDLLARLCLGGPR